MVGSDGEPQSYAQLGQHHPRRITVSALGPALLFEKPPDLADMAGTGHDHVPEHCPACGLQAGGGGGRPELAFARSDRFVLVLSGALVELPESRFLLLLPRASVIHDCRQAAEYCRAILWNRVCRPPSTDPFFLLTKTQGHPRQ